MRPSPADTPLLPLFPLQTVLFPGGLLQLKVFEARYLDLIGQCLREGSGFGVVALRSGHEVQSPGQAAGQTASPTSGPSSAQVPTLLHEVAVQVRLLEVDAEQAGILRVRCEGGLRQRLQAPHQRADGLWLATAEPLPADATRPVPPELAGSAEALQRAIVALGEQGHAPFLSPHRLHDAGWVANRWCELLPMPLAAKQGLMALQDPLTRLKLVDEHLRRQQII